MSSVPSSTRPSAAELIASIDSRVEEPPAKVPRLEDTMVEMRQQNMLMMKMFEESQKNMMQVMEFAKQTAFSTNELVKTLAKQNQQQQPQPQQQRPQMQMQHQAEVFTEAWSSAAASVVEGAATQAATSVFQMMKQANPKLPEAVVQCIEKTSMSFMKDVRKYARSAKAFDDAHEKYTIMAEDAQSKRYPPGTRPFASSSTFGELDEGWSQSRENPMTVAVTIPAGTCRRDAMRILHHSMTCHIKSIELEALKVHRDAMVSFANKDTLRKRCLVAIEEVVTKDADVRNLAIDSPDCLKVDEELVNKKVDEKYNQVVKKVVDEISRAEEKKDKDKLKEEQELKQFSQQRPESILKDLVSHFVSEEVYKHQEQEDEPMRTEAEASSTTQKLGKEDPKFDERDAVSQLVQVIRGDGKGKGPSAKGKGKGHGQKTKNGESPGAAPGHHATPAKPMGNGKGWWGNKHYKHAAWANKKQQNTGQSKGKPQSKGKGKQSKGQGKKGGDKGKRHGGRK